MNRSDHNTPRAQRRREARRVTYVYNGLRQRIEVLKPDPRWWKK